jgi:hypothetical protein
MEGAILQRLHGRAHGRLTCDQHDRHVGVVFAQLAQELDAVHFWHRDIGHDHVELSRPKRGERRLPVPLADDVVALFRQEPADALEQRRLVIHDEDISACPIRARHGQFAISGSLVDAARCGG